MSSWTRRAFVAGNVCGTFEGGRETASGSDRQSYEYWSVEEKSLSLPETNSNRTWKWMLFEDSLVSFWVSFLFSGALAVSFREGKWSDWKRTNMFQCQPGKRLGQHIGENLKTWETTAGEIISMDEEYW